jgi:hypothetical protein
LTDTTYDTSVRYVSVSTDNLNCTISPSLTEVPNGNDKSIMVLLSVESFLGTEDRGAGDKGTENGFLSNVPTSAL